MTGVQGVQDWQIMIQIALRTMSKTLGFLSNLLKALTQNVSWLDIAASALDSLRVPWQKLIAWAESNESITASHTPNQIPVFFIFFLCWNVPENQTVGKHYKMLTQVCTHVPHYYWTNSLYRIKEILITLSPLSLTDMSHWCCWDLIDSLTVEDVDSKNLLMLFGKYDSLLAADSLVTAFS